MKKVVVISFLLVFVLSLLVSAQQEEAFKPNGKPEVTIFTNFSSIFSDEKNFNKFDVTRAYFGYVQNFSKTLTGRVVFDVGNPNVGDFHYTAFLKFAYLQYRSGKFTFAGGMIPTPQYELVDRLWGYRYVFKPSHDQYGFGPAADLGVRAVYKISDRFSADGMLVNGESFKKVEADSVFRAGIGLTFYPVKNLLLRGYFDTMKKNGVNQETYECIIAYEDKSFNLSAVYNFQTNRANKPGQDITGLSFNGSLSLKGNKKLFARFDHSVSEKTGNSPDPWNLSKDGNLFLAGFEFSPVTGIRLSPNFQRWQPADDNKPFISTFSLSAEIKL